MYNRLESELFQAHLLAFWSMRPCSNQHHPVCAEPMLQSRLVAQPRGTLPEMLGSQPRWAVPETLEFINVWLWISFRSLCVQEPSGITRCFMAHMWPPYPQFKKFFSSDIIDHLNDLLPLQRQLRIWNREGVDGKKIFERLQFLTGA